MSQKILITGASGFVGSRLAARLVELGYNVYATVRLSTNLWCLQEFRQHISFCTADLGDLEQVNKVIQQVQPDVVFHLACYGGFADESDGRQTLTINALGTYYLLDACSKTGVGKFIYVGSSSEYGVKTHAMAEDDLERPANIYGVSKLAASNLVRVYAESTKLPATILRIFSPYGMYDDYRRLIPTVINACLLQKELKLGSGKQVRDFVYVEDLVDAFMLAMKKAPLKGEIINLGFGKQHTIRKVVDIILDECGHPIKPLWAAFPDRDNEPSMWQANNTKAKKLLDWQPRVELHEGLRSTIAWMAQQINREKKS